MSYYLAAKLLRNCMNHAAEEKEDSIQLKVKEYISNLKIIGSDKYENTFDLRKNNNLSNEQCPDSSLVFIDENILEIAKNVNKEKELIDTIYTKHSVYRIINTSGYGKPPSLVI